MALRDILDGVGLPPDCHPKIAATAEYWHSLAPGEGFPGRQHIDPTDIPGLLPGVWLIDVQRNPLSFMFRIVGTGVV